MALINGGAGNDPLNGTGDADIINGLGGNDTINGGAGNDTINPGAGTDSINGGDDDDTIIIDTAIQSDKIDGGNGIDTILLQVPTGGAPSQNYSFSGGNIFSTSVLNVERLQFATLAGQSITSSFNYAQFAGSGITEIVGGAGRDTLGIIFTTSGSYSLSGITFTGWANAPTNAWDPVTDTINLVGSLPVPAVAVEYTLTASNSINAMQALTGSLGNDTLVGSDHADRLNGGGGVNTLIGGGGNDMFLIVNQSQPLPPFTGGYSPPTTFNGAGTMDGGSGTDVLGIGGFVALAGTLTSIEGVQFLPEIVPVNNSAARQERGTLSLDGAHVTMLPTDTFFMGTGTVVIGLDNGQSFSGAGYTFTAGSNVNFEIHGGDGDGVSIVGTSNSDFIEFGSGVQSATGGGGNDTFAFGAGTNTITDFTQGQDKVDLQGSGIDRMDRLVDFLSDGPGGARVSADTGGDHFELDLNGVVAASLTAADFVFGGGSFSVFNPGTNLDDVLFGYGQNDTISGGDGNDRIYTGGGLDVIDAGSGNDTVIIDGPSVGGISFVPPKLLGGSGDDTLVVRPSAQGLTTSGFLSSVAFYQMSGFETLKFESQAGGQLRFIVGAWQIGQFSAVQGGAGTDILIISANLDPSDTYTIPVLNLVGWGADDAVSLSVGTGTHNTTLNSIAHSGIYALTGGSGNDTLNGSSGIEVLNGFGGDDLIVSGGGADSIDGGQGTDTVVFDGAYGSYTITIDGSTVHVGAASVTNVEVFKFAGIKYLWNGTTLEPANHPPVANADAASVNEDATATGNVLTNDTTGETDPGAPDVLSVTSIAGIAVSGATVVHGQYGTLTISADGSYSYTADADLLDALPAGTVLSESFAYDISDGQGASASSSLTVTVTTTNDLVSVSLGNGAASFTGTSADEVVQGGNGNDALYGLDGSDRIYGGAGADQLFGGNGWDFLSGGLGSDSLYGGDGNDVLFGGKGVDQLFGGAGADTFLFGAQGGADVVGDFQLGLDHIALADGISVIGHHASAGGAVLDLSGGGSITLAGVADAPDIVSVVLGSLPDWAVGISLG